MSDDKMQPEVQTVGEMKFFKNALIFEDTAYQVSNISAVWVADYSHTVIHKLPGWIVRTGIAGLLLAVGGTLASTSQSQGNQRLWGLIFMLAGIVICWIAFNGYRRHKPTTAVSNFALGIELTSGRRALFSSSDQGFVQRAAHCLINAIADKQAGLQEFVMNFDNKSINIENVDHSNIIGGNVTDSFVGNI